MSITPTDVDAEDASAVDIAVEHRRRHLEQARPELEEIVEQRRTALAEAIDDVAFVDAQLAELDAYQSKPPAHPGAVTCHHADGTAHAVTPGELLHPDTESVLLHDVAEVARCVRSQGGPATVAVTATGMPVLLTYSPGSVTYDAWLPFQGRLALKDLSYPLRVVELR